MPKCIELLPCDWLISNLYYQAIEQVYLIKWPVSVFIFTFMHLADAFIQSDLLCIQAINFLSLYVFPGN